ncbi:MAG: DUF2269 family protein [Gemmatimonadota bacterium]
MSYRGLLLFVHVLGVILWVGVAVALPFVTGRARRTGDLEIASFAYGVADRLTRTIGLAGMVLTLLGGVGLVVINPAYGWFQPFPDHWLFQMQILGFLSFGVGAFYQVPLAGRLAREAEASARDGEPTERFGKLRKRHAIVGSVNGFLLLVVVLLGTVRP